MNTKLVLIIAFISTHALAMNNYDFSRRFGPDSHIYNIPLYFGQTTAKHPKKNQECSKASNTRAKKNTRS